MTEDEAKTKWCPFSRAVVGSPGEGVAAVTNRAPVGSQVHADTLCIGSACMAWRYHGHIVDRATGLPIEKGKAYLTGTTEERYSEHGFCGLAGTP